MKVATCVLLLMCVALAQQQPPPPPAEQRPPPPPGGPSGPPPPQTSGPGNGPPMSGPVSGPVPGPVSPQQPETPVGTPAAMPPAIPPGAPADATAGNANPWHELLHRMMELMQTAAGMEAGPSGAPPAGGPAGPMTPGANVEYKINQGGPGPNPGSNQGPGQMPGPGPMQGPMRGPDGPMSGLGQMQGRGSMGPGQNQGSGIMGPGSDGPKIPPPKNPSFGPPEKPAVQDCFWEGKYYQAGSDIVRGQHDRWCYVTYCDSKGNIQFWDDYNCPPNSMKPTSGHNTGRPSPTAAPGCNHNGMFYEPGQEISSNQVGDRCYGTYCNDQSQVVQWEDWCPTQAPPAGAGPQQGPAPTAPVPNAGPAPVALPQRAANPPPAQARQAPVAQAPPPVSNAFQTQSAATPGQTGGRRGPKQGCYHNSLYYQPNEDVIIGNIGDMCYGYYCEGDNVFVHWEDRCASANVGATAAAPTPTTAPLGATGSFWI